MLDGLSLIDEGPMWYNLSYVCLYQTKTVAVKW